MDKAGCRVVRSEAAWQAIFEAQERSHWSGAGFCREHGIEYKQFLYHRHKIRKRRGKQLATVAPAGAVPVVRHRGFIPIRIEGSCGVRLHFSRGLVLESDQLPPAAWVVEVAERWMGGAVASC